MVYSIEYREERNKKRETETKKEQMYVRSQFYCSLLDVQQKIFWWSFESKIILTVGTVKTVEPRAKLINVNCTITIFVKASDDGTDRFFIQKFTACVSELLKLTSINGTGAVSVELCWREMFESVICKVVERWCECETYRFSQYCYEKICSVF